MTSPDPVARQQRKTSELYARDPQIAAARPDPTLSSRLRQTDSGLPEVIDTVFTGYAERPAAGVRAAHYIFDSRSGRTSLQLESRFDTITYADLDARTRDLASVWSDEVVRPGDRVAILGFTSLDYMTIDIALARLGAVSVPLQTGAASATLTAIVTETSPVLIAADVAHLPAAVELALATEPPARVLVFDYHDQVDDQRETVAAATERLAAAGGLGAVESLGEAIERGRTSTPAGQAPADHADQLELLVYTSGSTGTPKGAMYRASAVAAMWRNALGDGTDEVEPQISLAVMPMSHAMGRISLYRTLGAGGTVFFSASSDLSTFLEDLALTRPTQMVFVPRIWSLIVDEVTHEVDGRLGGSTDRTAVENDVTAELRQSLLGGRQLTAMTASAPMSNDTRDRVEKLLGLHLQEVYASTEAGQVFVDGHIQRPPVIDYKLIDVPELGYYLSDRPFPRGELLVKSASMFPGYYHRDQVTAEVFDQDGYYRTGDIVAELAIDHVQLLDRRNNVLKLSQGEFVTVSAIEATLLQSPSIHQIYVYGNGAQPYLLAVVVPAEDLLARHDGDELNAAVRQSITRAAKAGGLQSYEIPRDVLIERTPFSADNGLLTEIGKPARPQLVSRYGDQLEQLYSDREQAQIDELRAISRGLDGESVLESISRAAGALFGVTAEDVRPDSHFADLGGDSLSAVTFANLLSSIYDVEVPVSELVSATSDLAQLADYVERQLQPGAQRPTFASVHGRGSSIVYARDLTLDQFIDAETLAAAPSLPTPSEQVRTVLITGATGFLGRYLMLYWLQRMHVTGGTVICLVRAKDETVARERLADNFASGTAELEKLYRELAAEHLEVLVGDKAEANLGLASEIWQRLADTVDLIVDAAALVNHVLPYRELFGPNTLGTAELIRLALTTKIKRFAFVSTVSVGDGIKTVDFTEDADIRVISSSRTADDGYANGYGNSKWAAEVLLREAHDLCALPVTIFRCGLIMAETRYTGQLNVPDMFTRMIFSVLATGLAPGSFYTLDADGHRQRAHYDGLPVDFVAEAISILGANTGHTLQTYHVMNPHDDGAGLDQFVDWLIDAGQPITLIANYDEWLRRFDGALRSLPDDQRRASLLPILGNYQNPATPRLGSSAPTDRFQQAVRDAKVGAAADIPTITAANIIKYATDLRWLGLL